MMTFYKYALPTSGETTEYNIYIIVKLLHVGAYLPKCQCLFFHESLKKIVLIFNIYKELGIGPFVINLDF